jgi:hypothetical protein
MCLIMDLVLQAVQCKRNLGFPWSPPSIMNGMGIVELLGVGLGVVMGSGMSFLVPQ